MVVDGDGFMSFQDMKFGKGTLIVNFIPPDMNEPELSVYV